MFKWFFNQVRKIARDPRGFIKFGQITFILLSWSVLILILFYYIFVPEDVNAVAIILTVVIGFLGTILGLFFSEKALERLTERINTKDEQLKEIKESNNELVEDVRKIKSNIKKWIIKKGN